MCSTFFKFLLCASRIQSLFFCFAKILLLQISNYEKELEEMKHMTRQEYIAYLRRFVFDAYSYIMFNS